jgi:hypothetical protein
VFQSLTNPLATRADLQSLLLDLAAPLRAHVSEGRARVRLGTTAAHYSQTCARLEGFSRPLWGLGPLAAGTGELADAERFCEGLMNGTDSSHPEYWGTPANNDQRLMELGPIAFALCIAPEFFWRPLSHKAQSNLTDYLQFINARELPDSNWRFVRVLVNLALHRLGRETDLPKMFADVDRLESFYLGEGWYSDGPTLQRDYYVAFAMHFYGLLYSALATELDPGRCARFRERAAIFAKDFIHWFAADGSALPFGRSLTYRFAQGAFWGALAFADVEALPWEVIKGLHLRHLRWWLRQDIFSDTGLLTIGYGYPNLNIAEAYSSPASPYWAFKAFLPLALPQAHPFWSSDEESLPELPPVVQQSHPQFIVCRDRESDHVWALAGGQWADWQPRHVAEKYSKFCYSNKFAFSVPSAAAELAAGAHDNMLALGEEGVYFRVRRKPTRVSMGDDWILSEWEPWPDVHISTWLVPAGAWHVRVHYIRAGRKLLSAEGGFALPWTGEVWELDEQDQRSVSGAALVTQPSGASLIRDLLGTRKGRIVESAPNTNLLHPRTAIPTLIGRHKRGDHWLACAVLASPDLLHGDSTMLAPPRCDVGSRGFVVADAEGNILLSQSADSRGL